VGVVARQRSSAERLARHREEKRLQRERRLARLRAKRMRVARVAEEMHAGASFSEALRIAHTTRHAVSSEASAASFRLEGGRWIAQPPSRVRINLGRASALTLQGVMPVRLRTLRDWELWQAQDRLLHLVAEKRPVPPELERKLRGANIDGLTLVSSPEVVLELVLRGALDTVETLSPTLTDDEEVGG
jgi:hypothetical protein